MTEIAESPRRVEDGGRPPGVGGVDSRAISPYPGLEPYTEQNAAFFFGRENETQIIAANLLSERLTLLYGPSGVGKSSVLQAGVLPYLHARAESLRNEVDSPGLCVVVVSKWHDDPLVAVASGCREAATNLVGRHDLPEPAPKAPLAEVLAHWSSVVGGRLLLILDQFEEYFLYHTDEHGEGTLNGEFPAAVASPEVRANFLVSIREDALARLDCFKGRIPRLFENRLQVDRLTVRAARAAVKGPIDAYNRQFVDGEPYSIEDELVDAVLADVQVRGRGRSGVVGPARAASAVRDGSDGEARVETPILQVVLRTIWEHETRSGERKLHAKTLVELGGVETILRNRFVERMGLLTDDEQDVAADIFQFLVTASGSKVAWSAAELAQFSELPEAKVQPVLRTLSGLDARILKPVPSPGEHGPTRYEIFHDVLAAPVREWRLEHVARREGRELARRRLRRIGRFLALVAAAIIVGLAIVASLQWNRARDSEHKARREAAKAFSLARVAANDEDKAKRANTKLNSVVWGVRLVETINDTIGKRTGKVLRVLGFWPVDGRPGAYQIQFRPDGLTRFQQYAKIWVWPSDRRGKIKAVSIYSLGKVTPERQLRSRNRTCGRKYVVHGAGSQIAQVNLLWPAPNCGVRPPGWGDVDGVLTALAKGFHVRAA